jgi:hypothetical protein
MPLFEAFQWPRAPSIEEFEEGAGTYPEWIEMSFKDHSIRVVDGDAHVVTSKGRVMARAGEYIILDVKDNLHVVSAEVYHALRNEGPQVPLREKAPEPDAEPHDPLVAQAVEMVSTLGSPPFSSAVLARSARAREAQAEWERQQPKPDPHNAQVEGANTPE